MPLTVNAKTYTADSFAAGSVSYNGPAKTSSVKDNILLRRTDPKPTATDSGVAHTLCKLTRTNTLTGAKTPTWDMIVKIEVSVPVGSASADIDAALNDLGAFLGSATFKTHVKEPRVNF